MKKLALLLAAVMVICSFGAVTVFAADSWATGTGVEGDPYIITTADEFVAMSTKNSAYYKIDANIDLDGVEWTPFEFKGHLDGGNKEITNVSNVLFSRVNGENAVVENVIIKSGTINGAGSVTAEVTNGATVRGCVNYADVTGSNAGGVVGKLPNGTVEDCVNYGTVTGTSNECGGVVGHAWVGSNTGVRVIKNCTNYGKVTSSDKITIAGIVGIITYGEISDCINKGEISAVYTVAGIVASAGSSTIENSTNEGNITVGLKNPKELGGIVGVASGNEENPMVIKNCTNKGAIGTAELKSTNVGGIAGVLSSYATAEDCTNDGVVSSTYDVIGGIAGVVKDNSTVTNCVNTNNISGASIVGGIVGNVETSTGSVTKSHNSGNVTGTGQQIGGVIGRSSAEIISLCSNTGVVTGSKNTNTGGILGQMYAVGTLKDCYNASNSTGAGGLVGAVEKTGASILNCYVYGDAYDAIDGWKSGGASDHTISNVYYCGTVERNQLGATEMTADEFADGTVVDLLNGSRTGAAAVWEQGELYPVFKVASGEEPEPVVTSAEITGVTDTTVSYEVTLADEDATAVVIVALYNGDQLFAVKTVSADETSAVFETTVGATDAKIFIWENLTTLKPIVMDEYDL